MFVRLIARLCVHTYIHRYELLYRRVTVAAGDCWAANWPTGRETAGRRETAGATVTYDDQHCESTAIQCLEGAYNVRHLRNIAVTYRRKTFNPSYRRSGGGCGRRRRTRGPDLQNIDMGTHYMNEPRSICQRAKYSPCRPHYIHI